MISAMQQQLDFIAYIQRMLVEGEFTATYKYALLHAIADICVEQQNEDQSAPMEIKIDTLVDKFIQLYWNHSMPYAAHSTDIITNTEDMLLKQNSQGQAKFITEIYKLQNAGVKSYNAFKNYQQYNQVISSLRRTFIDGPLWRLQLLSGKEECFLYPHILLGKGREPKRIVLNAGISQCFRRFYDLVVHLSVTEWIEKVQTIKANQTLLGSQSQLQEFLFGSNRTALKVVTPLLIDIQNGLCFYCQKPMNLKNEKETKKTPEIDHFIPFKRYPNDLAHNFVAAHADCNNNKRDHLAAFAHRDRWLEQNLDIHKAEITNKLQPYFYCDADKSLAVSNWAYQVAESSSAKLWLGKNSFEQAKPTAELFTFPNAPQPELNQVAEPAVSLKSVDEALKLPYFPNIKIACGHFKTGDSSDVEYLDAPLGAGKLDPNVHFLARASGNSMNGGKHPILDGDLLLLELITSDRAGSLRGQIVAIERDDISGDGQYLLRKVNKLPNGQYELVAQNPDYEVMIADESMRTFARLKQVVL
ncbi:S24 family peptidase [Pseudoalteromonas sp. Angola-18]|uniref:S24 family peptidase n=1 Tax=Pseudoalteromonas sp. Angola-18 TaxID=3025338 RepID=UPI0023585ADF|nr:S24 family peptidase [Pseudoalteromonas sp. Angola-18]MDC9503677.1 S24 family peptidase [Pseudoalteromonas sp. Angola-18]